ncbi:MAG: DUF309 domain-containing protein, partial [Bacteroidia bacterium]|nr:DUF309 domain-containing protein [Bacteroidia bacterium]
MPHPALSNPDFLKGIQEFNNKDFFDAHDTFEAIWHDVRGKEKRCYQAIIQLAIGYYHLCFLNFKGAQSMLTKAVEKLADYQPHALGLDTKHLLEKTEYVLSRIEELAEGKILLKDMPPDFIPKIIIAQNS